MDLIGSGMITTSTQQTTKGNKMNQINKADFRAMRRRIIRACNGALALTRRINKRLGDTEFTNKNLQRAMRRDLGRHHFRDCI